MLKKILKLFEKYRFLKVIAIMEDLKSIFF